MPAYRYHVSGQAVVTLAGKDFYLGIHDSPESRARYFALLSQYNANGKRAPEAESHQAEQPITVRCVAGEYREHAVTKYAANPQELNRFQNLCTTLEDEHGDEPAADFGPRKLAALRELFIASGNSRTYVNRQTRNIVLIFRHAVSRELIDEAVIRRLETLEPLRRGQTKARDMPPIQPVNLEVVRQTAVHLSPTLQAMVRIQVSTGMRPSEVCAIRPCDVDRSAKEWIYRPVDHKTAWRGKTKAIPIMGDARDALTPFLFRDPESFCFSPKESVAWRWEKQRENRQTKVQPSQVSRKKSNPKKQPGDKYTSASYRRALKRAAEIAKVDHWFPYQLRHTAGTVVREALGIEAAQALLGHSKAAMTEHYAKQSEAKAIEAAKAAPRIGSM
jgi:integrase